MRLLRGLLPVIAVAVAAGIVVPLVLAGNGPEDIKMSETTSFTPAAGSPYRVATFSLG